MEYFRRLRNFWFPHRASIAWFFLALPALYFLQTSVHEGTHGMAALIVSGHAPTVAPFPHMNEDDKGKLHFLNGVTFGGPETRAEVSMRKDCDTEQRLIRKPMAGNPAAPQFVAFFLIVLASLVFVFFTMPYEMARFPLRMLFLGFCIDFMYGTIRGLIAGCNESADWSKFYLQSEMSRGVFAGVTWIFWILILSHFVWVYWSAWGRERVPKVGFFGYRWMSFGLGILSLICVIVSLAIGDDEIHKDTAAFILPFIAQVLAVGWYFSYFGMTFKKSWKGI